MKRKASWSTSKNSQRYLKSLVSVDKIFEKGSMLLPFLRFACLLHCKVCHTFWRSVTWAPAQSSSEPWPPLLSKITGYKKVLGLPSLFIKYSSCFLPLSGVSGESRRPKAVMVQALWQKSRHESSTPTTLRITALLAKIGPILCFHTSQTPEK